MILHSYLFRKVTIIGVGLMGGSLGMALKKHKLAREVIGLSQKQSSLLQAVKSKAIDTATTDIPKAIRNSDLVILATPVQSIIKIFHTINPHLKRGCIITDLGSAKLEITEASEKILANFNYFIGSHPLVGSEKVGIENARDDLFDSANCILTPTKQTHSSAQDKVKKMWEKLGAKVSVMTPQEHDKVLGAISHLPHLLSFALMNILPKDCIPYATQSLKDSTRIAASSPQMWNDIFISNSKNVLSALDDLITELAYFRKIIIDKDEKALLSAISKAKDSRDNL